MQLEPAIAYCLLAFLIKFGYRTRIELFFWVAYCLLPVASSSNSPPISCALYLVPLFCYIVMDSFIPWSSKLKLIIVRNFTRCTGLLLLVLATTNGFAQKQPQSSTKVRCGAVAHLEALFKNDPQARARNEENQRQAAKLRQEYLSR